MRRRQTRAILRLVLMTSLSAPRRRDPPEGRLVHFVLSHHFTSFTDTFHDPKRVGGSRFITFGGSGGMATRKTAPRGKRPRGGLRSRAQAVAERDPVWDTAESAEDEEGAEAFPKASSESHTPKVKSDASGSTSDEGLLSLMRRFLDAQEQREERHLAELQGLREVILQSARPPETPSDVRSLRMSLPTPAASRTTHAHSTDTPASQSSNLGWPVEEWSFRLVPLLTGQALDAYLAMDEERAGVYADLKEALLEKFNISAETYRQRFRASTTPAGESPTETYNRLRTLYCRWVRPDLHTKEEIGETIILEQLLRVLPYDSRTWVREHEPTTGLAAAKLALQYMNAHRGAPRTQPLKGTVQKQNTAGVGALPGPAGGNISVQKPKSERQELVCFYCQQPGHKASVCPVRKAKLTGFCYVPREEDNDIDFGVESQMLCDVTVDGHSVKALLDTGSSLSLLKPGFVSKIDYATTTTIQCVHGDIRRYPRAEVVVCAQEQSFLMNVVIADDLPADMILGRDLPVLFELLQTTMNSDTVTSATVHKSCPVVTRAQAKEGLQPLPDLHCSLLQGGTKGPRKPRRQRRLEKYLGTPVPKVSVEGLKADDWRIPENIGELQRKDESLKSLFEKAASGKDILQHMCNMSKDQCCDPAGPGALVPSPCYFYSLESLRYYLLGREFDLETDHRALTWIQTMKDHNSRVMRWYLSLQPYKFKVRHRPGRQNVVADYLSRYPNSTQPREGGGGVIK
ncbi:hypothetical protein QQF64_014528 [Cirrhinus molitorella]|uniref:SCAN box domain-containing protein n=1 Tax=Cirrhinus molitorella TaxID=172907 RepID=A0ABR3NSD1_9TELE